ncbi:hypothetical protein [Streptomyces sp. NPDC048527]|uniref:hypothetical protein n=1 Tax=Streptomyces sp. NPDC048527 TaxID=3365568 RepID=UPI003718F698
MTPDLTRLTELLPRPQDSVQAPDWNAAESTLRTALPADYKELIDGYLLLLEPGCRNDVYDLIKISAEREEANDTLWQPKVLSTVQRRGRTVNPLVAGSRRTTCMRAVDLMTGLVGSAVPKIC